MPTIVAAISASSGLFWPMCVETLRLMVIPPMWQSLFVAVGLGETHDVGWLPGIGIGLMSEIQPHLDATEGLEVPHLL